MHQPALRFDVQRTGKQVVGSRAARILTILLAPGIQALVVLRFGQWLLRRRLVVRLLLTPLYHLAFRRVRSRWGIEIPRRTEVGPGLYIGHSGGIVVSTEARIGRGVTLSHGVTIGVATRDGVRGAPTLEDEVYVAPGANLSGPIRIGYRARIGPNAVVFEDVPARAKVVSQRPRVIAWDPPAD